MVSLFLIQFCITNLGSSSFTFLAVAVTKEAERGIVDIETLTHTNEELINTLNDIQTIQKEGREKRIAAEAELGRIENELKQKLININS